MFHRVLINRKGEEWYLLYPSGLLTRMDKPREDTSVGLAKDRDLKLLKPSLQEWNRFVTVNSLVRKMLGLNPDYIKKI